MTILSDVSISQFVKKKRAEKMCCHFRTIFNHEFKMPNNKNGDEIYGECKIKMSIVSGNQIKLIAPLSRKPIL